LQTAVRLAPENAFARFDLGVALAAQNDLPSALGHLREAVRLMPHGFDRLYNPADMQFALAEVYFRLARYAESVGTLEGVLRTSPAHAPANYLMALARGFLGETVTTVPFYERAARADPRLAALPDYYDLLSRNYLKNGAYAQALECSEKGCQLALAAGRAKQADALRARAEFCRSRR
jgi:tetratricopeptide (TPR) repeat protein